MGRQALSARWRPLQPVFLTFTGSMSTSPFSMRRNSWKSWMLTAVKKSFRKKRRWKLPIRNIRNVRQNWNLWIWMKSRRIVKWLFWNLRSMRLRKHLWFQEKTKNWKSSIESSPMDAELSIPCKVPMPLPDMTDREPGKQWERLFGSFPEWQSTMISWNPFPRL